MQEGDRKRKIAEDVPDAEAAGSSQPLHPSPPDAAALQETPLMQAMRRNAGAGRLARRSEPYRREQQEEEMDLITLFDSLLVEEEEEPKRSRNKEFVCFMAKRREDKTVGGLIYEETEVQKELRGAKEWGQKYHATTDLTMGRGRCIPGLTAMRSCGSRSRADWSLTRDMAGDFRDCPTGVSVHVALASRGYTLRGHICVPPSGNSQDAGIRW